MKVAGILFTVAIIVLIYLVIRYFFKGYNALTTLVDANVMTTVDASSLALNTTGNANNFAYSIWFYVQDWNYRYGERKVVFGRMNNKSSNENNSSIPGVNGFDPSPLVFLEKMENNIVIALGCYPSAEQIANDYQDGSMNSTSTSTVRSQLHLCEVANVPIQRWVNLLVSVYGRTLDVYMDGKLVKTCLLPGIAMVNPNANVYVTPNGGFSGYTSKLQYWSTAINPQQAWNTYTKGYGANVFNNNYQLTVSVENNGSTVNSFTT